MVELGTNTGVGVSKERQKDLIYHLNLALLLQWRE